MIVEPDFPTHWKTQVLHGFCLGYLHENPTETQTVLSGTFGGMLVVRLWAHCQQRKAARFEIAPAALAAVCGWQGNPEWLVSKLAESGFIERDGRAITVHEWEEVNAKLVSNWRNGSNGGRPRKNPTTTDGKPNGNPNGTDGEPIEKIEKIGEEGGLKAANASLSASVSGDDSSPVLPRSSSDRGSLKKRKARALPTVSAPAGFAEFWAAYPNKKKKLRAVATWRALQKTGALPALDVILAAIETQKRSEDWQREGGRFIPHPATWLNGGAWDDESAQPSRVAATPSRVAIVAPASWRAIYRELFGEPPPDGTEWEGLPDDIQQRIVTTNGGQGDE